MNDLTIPESYGIRRTAHGYVTAVEGEVEIEIRDLRGNIVERHRQHNQVKIFAKEILSHRLPSSVVWDPNAGTGTGDWVTHDLELDDWAPKYICFGASFDDSGVPLDRADTRYYTPDPVSGGFVPKTLGVGAEYGGGLINAIPISAPHIPIKRVERIFFESSYQPAGSPLVDSDVRAVNNVVVLETTLRKDEYNGFGITTSDFFTLTEVALVAGKRLPPEQGLCECDPRTLFLEGNVDETALDAITSGTASISLDPGVSPDLVASIVEGDQVKIVRRGSNRQGELIDELGQVSPYYLVINKATGGRDMVLDRTPVDADGVPLAGDVGVFRDGFRIFSHRILKVPVKKSSDYELTVRWRLIFN